MSALKKRAVVKNLLLLVFIFLVGLFYLRTIERKSIYFPLKRIEDTPQAAGVSYEDVFIKTQDGEMLHAWFIPQTNSSSVVLFLHGNGGNLSHRIEKVLFFHRLGNSVLIADYRGYGRSTGHPTERGLYADALACYEYLTGTKGFPPVHIVLYGESLGSAVAIDLAAKRRIRALIAEGAFTSVADMSKKIYPFLPTFMLKERYDSLSKIKRIAVPKLFIHSVNDEIVPYAFGRRLFEAAPAPKDFLEIRGGHNEGFFFHLDAIKAKVSAFLAEYRKTDSP